ncbi:MAG TPA: hypothetical protein VFR89_07290 [candidate division Zixibacteria bacterium]|nr:hypothetical protein [candidate division Zixibacteria bacterium]
MKQILRPCFFFLAVFFGLLTLAKGQPSPNDSLIVLPVSVFNGQTTVSIPISLANSVPISGIAGRMVFDSAILSPAIDPQSGLVSIERVERGLALSESGASSSKAGVLTFLMLTSVFPIEKISPGSGPVCRINFNILISQDTITCIRLEDDPSNPFEVRNQLSDEIGLFAIFPTLQAGGLLIGKSGPEGGCLQSAFKLGDLNLDVKLAPADVVLLLNCLFLTDTWNCPLYLTDTNCDGSFTTADVVDMLNAAFLGDILSCP